MAYKVTDLKDDKAIVSAIDSVIGATKALQSDVHVILCVIAARWHETGDYRPALMQVNRLLKGMDGTGIRANALRTWIEAKLMFVFPVDAEGEAKNMAALGRFKDGKHIDVLNCTQEPWYTFTKEAPYKPLDGEAMLLDLVKRLNAAKPEKGDKPLDPALMQAMNAMAAQLRLDAAQREAKAALDKAANVVAA